MGTVRPPSPYDIHSIFELVHWLDNGWTLEDVDVSTSSLVIAYVGSSNTHCSCEIIAAQATEEEIKLLIPKHSKIASVFNSINQISKDCWRLHNAIWEL